MLKIKRLKIQIIQSFGSNKTKGPKQDSKNKVVSYHFTGQFVVTTAMYKSDYVNAGNKF
jgi:hypothetical protein